MTRAIPYQIVLVVSGLIVLSSGFIAPIACASEASIYGWLNVFSEYRDDTEVQSAYISSNGSRLGMRGAEGLGSDLKFLWQIESEVIPDASGNVLASRDSYVGLAGKWGTAKLGRQETPFMGLSRATDFFSDRVGDSRNVVGIGGSGWDLRMNNIVSYSSPDFDCFSVSILAGADEGTAESNLGSIGLWYLSAGFSLGGAFERHGKMMTAVDLNGDGIVDTTSEESEAGIRIAATWSIMQIKLTALFESLTDMGGVSGVDRSSYGAGACYKNGKNAIFGQFYLSDSIDGVSDDGSSLIALGFDRYLSDQTRLYITADQTDDGTYTELGGSVGMMHSF